MVSYTGGNSCFINFVPCDVLSLKLCLEINVGINTNLAVKTLRRLLNCLTFAFQDYKKHLAGGTEQTNLASLENVDICGFLLSEYFKFDVY